MGEDKIKRENRVVVLQSIRGDESTIAHSFNYTGGKCLKCGNAEHLLHFCHPAGRNVPKVRTCELDGEHIHRVCAACRWMWIERPLDQLLAAQERGEVTAENEMAASMAAIVRQHGGIRISLEEAGKYVGWVVRFHRDLELGILTVTADPPKEQRGEVVHPDVPLETTPARTDT